MRLAITFLALLAFTFQTLVVQTHIHGAARVGAASTQLALDGTASHDQSPDKFPPSDDPANCPICQELLHAGAFVTPTAAALQISTVVMSVDIVVVEIAAIERTFSHSWKSRAPPLA